MSSVYVLEPPTRGKVVMNTSMGPVDIELWPKEAPKATRNFVQLCLEGYYDRTIFHRVIKSFLVQGGDPTATGTGGESIYGAPFVDEFHSRLRFNHRGLIACANAGSPHSNGSQFFVTLDRCDWLDKKNTIFGKVTGDSIFNLLRIGDVETDKDDRPLDPVPTLISVEVLWNPFDDIIPRQIPSRHVPKKPENEKLDHSQKAVKKLNLLSFGEEAEEDEKELATVKDKIQSLHDVIDDPRFLKDQPQHQSSTEIEKKKDAVASVREALMKREEFRKPMEESISDDDGDDDKNDDEDGARFDARMRQQILRKRLERGEVRPTERSAKAKTMENSSPSPSRETVDDSSKQVTVEKLSIKKKGIGSEARANQMVKADTDLQLLGHSERERHLLKQKKRRLQGREDDTLAKLQKFKQKNISAKPDIESSTVASGRENDDVSGWITNQLKFAPDYSKKDGMSRNDDPNEYVVIDPLLEKGKEKFNKMQAKMKRKEREWAGKSLT